MYLFIAGFFANVWINYSAILITCGMWGMFGLGLVSPVLLADSVYRVRKTSNIYRFGKGYHLERREHFRDATLFGAISLLSFLFILFISLL